MTNCIVDTQVSIVVYWIYTSMLLPHIINLIEQQVPAECVESASIVIELVIGNYYIATGSNYRPLVSSLQIPSCCEVKITNYKLIITNYYA